MARDTTPAHKIGYHEKGEPFYAVEANGFTDEELLLMAVLGGAVLWLGGCGGSSQTDPASRPCPDPVVTMQNALASQLTRLYQPLSDRARPMQDSRLNASQPFNIQIETNTGSEILSFQLVRNQAADYPASARGASQNG
jgi:hypothetical protein